MAKLGFIGGGNMSTAIGESIIKSSLYDPANIWVSGPHLSNLKKWGDHGAHITEHNSDVIHNCDIIFLGVKPNILSVAVDQCVAEAKEEDINKEKLFVSMLAGVTLANLTKELSRITSKARVIRTMPNTPMLVGSGACLYTPGPEVTPDQCAKVERILGNCGVYERVKEEMIDSFGALTGCGPAFMYVILEALSDGAVKQGVPRESAIKFAAQMMLGSARMVLESGKHPGQLKDEVCSPGGSTICGVTELENGRIRATLISAIEASSKRNKELGQKKVQYS